MQIIRGDQIDFVPASHEDPKDPGVLKRVLATKSHLIDGRVQMVNWSRLPVGKSFQPHYHEDMQEVFIVLNGTVEMTVTDMTCTLNGGDAILRFYPLKRFNSKRTLLIRLLCAHLTNSA